MNISADFIWLTKEPNCEPCRVCKEVMVTATNILAIETNVGGKKHVEETKYAICNSCLDAIKSEEE